MFLKPKFVLEIKKIYNSLHDCLAGDKCIQVFYTSTFMKWLSKLHTPSCKRIQILIVVFLAETALCALFLQILVQKVDFNATKQSACKSEIWTDIWYWTEEIRGSITHLYKNRSLSIYLATLHSLTITFH